jgi:hypothetical protein
VPSYPVDKEKEESLEEKKSTGISFERFVV